MMNSKLLQSISSTLGFDPSNVSELKSFLNHELRTDLIDFESSDYSHLMTLRDFKLGFTHRLLYEYSKPIQRLEIFIEHCKTIGENTVRRISNEKTSKENALIRLHQKSTLISSEVVYLIKGGYASASISRWRSLFEASLTAVFLRLGDKDLSDRYLEYQKVEAKKELDTYMANVDYLGFEKIPQESIDRINSDYTGIKDKFGSDFCKPFGWACDALDNENPNLHHIMDYTESQYMKPFYKFSNNFIHSGPKSLMYNLGYIDGVLDSNTISCPSNIGFTDPAQLTALSYFNSTLALLNARPEKEDFTVILMLYPKMNAIAKQFVDIEKDIIEREDCD